MNEQRKVSTLYTRLAFAAAIMTFLLIVIGAITRVSESGMGCGTYWPDCNGRLIPEFVNTHVVIEFGHRLFAALVGVAALALLVEGFRKHRHEARLFYPAVLGFILYLLQAVLGQITVKTGNQWVSVLLHLANSDLLLACFVIAWVNARGVEASERQARPSLAEIVLGTLLAFGVVLIGAAVAGNNATKACVGWPLCLGEIWPADQGSLQVLNMTHRLVAGVLGIVLLYLFFRVRSGGKGLLYVAIHAALALYILQAAVGAAVVLINSPEWLVVAQSLHVTLAAATWSVMILSCGVVWLQQQSSKVTAARDGRLTAPSATISN